MTRSRLVLAAIVVFALVIAWRLRFGTDDAYISFVYAKSLVAGDGLTWFGTHVEGYTNFGWVLWTAGGLSLGIDPLVWAWAGSLAALAAVLVVTARIAGVRATSLTGLTAAAVLATNFTFLAFGTSGLETMAQTALLVTVWWHVERLRRDPLTVRRLMLLSTSAAFALWMRLDSAVMLVVLGPLVVHRLVTQRAALRLWIAALAPALVLVGGWLAWKLAYYGDVLPNTFYVKAGTGAVGQGAAYALGFLHAYLLWPFIVGIAVVALVRRTLPSGLPLVLAGVWILYVISVGGDFMEFRFFVPILPAIAVSISELVTQAAPARVPAPIARAAATIALLGAMSVRHAATFEGDRRFAYDSIEALATFYGTVPDGDWGRLGRPLHDVLGGTRATLACKGAGIIPYYAELPTVDQLGLNDAWVARNGVQPPPEFTRPGHQRFAPYEYLVLRKVTFVIGTPTLIAHGSLHAPGPALKQWLGGILGPAPIPTAVSFQIVAAPVDATHDLLLWYLTPSEEVTAAVRAAHWDGVSLRAH